MNAKILCRLQQGHAGHWRATPSKQLERDLKITGRQLRQVISDLRYMGHPICSGDEGYFFAQTREELEATIRQLNSRIVKIAKARNGLLRALSRFPRDDGQFSLLPEEGDMSE